MATDTKLYRIPSEGKILGVCAGLADYFGTDITLMRVIFVILGFITGGAMLILYFVLAFIMPSADRPVVSKNEPFGEKVEKIGLELRENRGINRLGNYFGVSLLVLGAWLLLGQFFPEWAAFRWEVIWPLILILSGVFIITKRK